MTDYSHIGQRTARSPLGERLNWHTVEISDDSAVFRMPFAKHNVTIGNMVHGGAVAALIDATATASCWATVKTSEESRGATIALNVNYLRAALGCDLEARAQVRHRGGSIWVVSVNVVDDEEVLIANATVTYKLSHGSSK